MTGISAVGGGMSSAQLEAEYAVRVAALQKNAIDTAGDMALKLIQSAAVDPATGGNINLQV